MHKLFTTVIVFISAMQLVWAGDDPISPQDTIRTYQMDEVVITSSAKETNNLRYLPGSISILSPQTINNRQIYALKDISSYVPNLHIPDYGSRQTSAIYIRGIGARSSGQSVGLYVDNVPYLDKSSFDFELMDIQHIEVLRGPQGTLYGRNAMGGIINIYTLSPLDYQGTRIVGTIGNHSTYREKFSHYAKLDENVGIAVSQYYDRNDGFFTNEYTGKKDNSKSMGVNLKLDWKIRPNLKAAYSINYDYTDQGAFPYGYYDKETKKIQPVNFNDPSTYNRRVLTNNLSFEYKTEKIILTSTTGYQYLKDDMIMDQDFTPKSIFTLNQKQNQKAFSEEIAIKSNTTANYQWSYGLYGFHNNLKTEGPVTFKEDGIKDIFQANFDNLAQTSSMPQLIVTDESIYIPGDFDTPSKGFALFHQSTYNNLFNEGLSLTAGLRLDYEKQKMHYQSISSMGLDVSMYGNQISLPRDYSEIDERIGQDFWQVLPKVALKYQCTPSTFTYFSVAKGYKTGGYNVQMSADVMQSLMQYDLMMKYSPDKPSEPSSIDKVMSYKPEHSWNYELGIRSELIKNKLFTELTLFYTDIRDLQITKFVDSGNGRILANAGKARSLGIEVSSQARLTNELTADLNYGYTHATFRGYIHEAKVGGKVISTDCDGNYLPYIPHHTLNIGLQYNKLVRTKFIDQFTASVQCSGKGKIYWTELNEIEQPFYATLNAKVGVRKGMVKVDLWTRNLTDTQFAAFYFESFNNPFIQKGKPFRIGVDVSLTF